MIAHAVFLQIRIVGVAGTERVDEIVVILRTRVAVADQQCDRRAGRFSLEHPGQDLDLVGLVTLRGVAALAGRTTIEIATEFFGRDRKPRWTAVDDAADRRAMAFAEGRDGEEFSERVAGHVLTQCSGRPT